MKINTKNDIFLSLLLHVGFIIFLILFAFVTKKKFDDLTYVEVSFGLNENLVQTNKFEKANQPEGERLALKSKNALPQITKDSAPITSKSSAATLTPKTEIPKPDDADMRLASKTKTAGDSTKNIKSPENTKLENKKTGNLDMKDFLKRKEESLRQTGDVAQTGQKQIEPNKKKGVKHSIADIPKSPFDTVKIPNAPKSPAPTGIETGSNLLPLDTYKVYLRNQLKLNWNLPDLSAFPSSLIVIVSFTINEFGYLMGDPKIVESSHNSEFDRLVTEAVKKTFPVANAPPKEIHPPQTFIAKYNSKDVR